MKYLLLLFLSVQSLFGATYYIATNGNNSWTGLSPTFTSGTTGPWADFTHVNFGGTPQLVAGDTLYVRGGVYDHHTGGTATGIFIASVFGTANSPVIVSNYPSEYPVIWGSATNNAPIRLDTVSWMRFIGINTSNAYNGVLIKNATNCEIAYCDFGGGDTNLGATANLCILQDSSQYNWVHNNFIHNSVADCCQDSGKGLTLGIFYSSTDLTAYNLVESNTCCYVGHDALSSYGPSNVLRFNWVHNEPFIFREDYQLLCGERDCELGGTIGNYNLFEHNWCGFAGVTGTGGSHGLEGSDIAYEIIRQNQFIQNDYSGLTIYGGKVGGTTCISNYVYNNTIYTNGYGPNTIQVYTNGPPWTASGPPVSLVVWQYPVTVVNSYSNLFVNNLLWGNNKSNAFSYFDGARDAAVFRNNLTNVNPGFVNEAYGGPLQMALPNLALTQGSAAIDAGGFLTTITSSSGSGTSFNVADSGFFFAGLTASGHVLAGDRIQLQGQSSTATITGISGLQLTVNTSLTWTNGQGVALAYNGSAPDVGALEFNAYPTSQITGKTTISGNVSIR